MFTGKIKNSNLGIRPTRSLFCLVLVFAGVGAGLTSTFASAQQSGKASEFVPYATISATYDSNFFRVEDFTQKPSDPDRGLSDTFAGIGAGFDSYVGFGFQKVTFAAEVVRQVHNDFSAVDFTGGNAGARLNWGEGELTSGALGYSFRRDLVDFVNQTLARIDHRNTHELDVSVSRRVSTRWRLGASARFSDIEFDEASENDPKRIYGDLSLTFVSRQANTVSLKTSFTERTTSGTQNLDYREFSVGPDMVWALSPKLRLRAEVKHTDRDADDPQLSDFEGLEGRMAVTWQAAPKLRLSSVLQRDVSSLGDQLSNYALVDSLRLSAFWEVSEKLSFTLAASRENRDFSDEPSALVPGTGAREDDLTYLTLRTDWSPRERQAYWLQVGSGDRNSSRPGQDFEYQQVSVGLRFYF